MGREFERDGELRTQPLPYASRETSVKAVWHSRNADDPALQWLRKQILDLASQVGLQSRI